MTQKPKRPRDANQLAKFIVDVATGEVVDKVDPATTQQRSAGAIGGATRALTLSRKQRSEIASKAAKARWAKSAAPSEEG